MKVTGLVPKYMKEFKCIGAECEDTCCALWKITIDKGTYDKYNRISKTSLRNEVKENLIKGNKDSFYDYSSFKLDPATGDCKMLKDGLCKIQAELGEHYLSYTCSTYPRKLNSVNEVLEVSASVSCPEVTRQALLNPDGIEFYEEELEILNNHRIENKVKVNEPQLPGISPYFWDIRILSIEILQRREFEISHRLLILGVFCEQLDKVIQKGEFDSIPAVIEDFRHYLETDKELRNFETFPVNNEFQLKTLNGLLMERMEKIIWNQRYKECVDLYVDGMQKCNSTDTLDLVNHFEKAYGEYYKPYMDEHEYIMENYLVNQLFGSLFPLSRYETIMHTYMMKVINYSLIKLHLIGMAAKLEGLTTDKVIQLIQSYAKNFEHSNVFIQRIYEKLKEDGFTTLGHMSLLIRN